MAPQKTTISTAEKTRPTQRLAKVVTTTTRGADRPHRVMTMNDDFFLWKAPLSNNNSWPHNPIIPGSSFVRFVSGIPPNNVGSNGVQYHKAQLEHSMTCIVSIIHFQFCIVLNCIMVGLKAIINNIINNICDINFVTDHKYLFRVVDISI